MGSGVSEPGVAGNKYMKMHAKDFNHIRQKRQKDRRTPQPRGSSGTFDGATAPWNAPVPLALFIGELNKRWLTSSIVSKRSYK
jgi:hypothetical protein